MNEVRERESPGDRSEVFELHCAEGLVTLRESYSFKTKALRRLMKEPDARLSLLCDEWERIHDADGR